MAWIADEPDPFVNEQEVLAALAERDVIIGDRRVSGDRLKKLAAGSFIAFEPPVVFRKLPGIIYACGRHTSIGRNCDFGMVERIGSFTTVEDDVVIGMAEHPTTFVSVANVFYASTAPTGFGAKDQPMLLQHRPQIMAAGRKHFQRNRQTTRIGNDVFIGAKSIILKGVSIGNGAIIHAGSVVTKDVPAYTVISGTPARPVRQRFSDAVIAELAQIRWWSRDMALMRKIDVSDVEAAVEKMKTRLAEDPARYVLKPKIIVVRRQPDGDLKVFRKRSRSALESVDESRSVEVDSDMEDADTVV